MSPKTSGLGFIFFSVLALCTAQVLIKDRFILYGSIPLSPEVFEYLIVVAQDPLIGLAVFAILSSSLSWYMGLSRLPLSVASPVTSLAYPIILITSFVFLDEPLSAGKIIGNALIVAGIVLTTVKPNSEGSV